MPLSINVGLNRKASHDFQSTGASINITAEFDGALLAHPEDLQRAIDNLYAQAREALDRQGGEPARAPSPPQRANRHSGKSYNGHHNRLAGQNGNGQAPKMSDGQRRAIYAIAGEREIDAYQTARATFNVDLDSLTARQASELIDNLKA